MEENFAKRLKELRKEKNLTQQQLAIELKIDKSTIAKYETEKIVPSIAMLKIFVDYFNVSAGYMLGWED